MTQAVSVAQYGSNNPTFRNRIINGGMVIDQRNAGGSITPTGSTYSVDRWRVNMSQSSKLTIQQNHNAVTPPAGYTNYLGVSVASAYTVLAADFFTVEQIIEGFNVADLGWGTANAVPATLSFWVRSSVTGSFGASVATANGTVWACPFAYTISAANTWTYVTLSIPASTSALPFTNNNAGVYVRFNLGSGSTSIGGTSGVWTSAGNYQGPSGVVSLLATNGATLYITGVQLEAGTTATPFEYRQYGTELALCQRYYFQRTYTYTQSSTSDIAGRSGISWVIPLPVDMRATPTIISAYSGLGNATGNVLSILQNFIQAGLMSVTAGGYAGTFTFTSASAEL